MEPTLFDTELPRGPQATARRTDPATSREAAAEHNASGRAKAHAEMVMEQIPTSRAARRRR